MNKIELLNNYVADLAVWNVKLHNLHWNVVGSQFMSSHKFTEALYEEVFEQYDSVAEQIKMLGETPVASVKEYLALSRIEEIPAVPVSTEKLLDIVKKDLEDMSERASEIRKIADEEGDFTTVALFEGLVSSYRKNIWFLSATQDK
ncbi:MAG: DNA starvation/stationary phase protection protein [Spirochaetales bacterium]|nr:DNA starvation/stationary phase protection protein [Spirochaetales bacterium]